MLPLIRKSRVSNPKGRGRNPDAVWGDKNKNATTREQRRRRDSGAAGVLMNRLAMTHRADLAPEFPLNVLYGRELITESQRDGGMRFAQCYWQIFGRPLTSEGIYHAMVAGFSEGTNWSMEESERDIEFEEAYGRYTKCLKEHPSKIRNEVMNIAVHLRQTRLITDVLMDTLTTSDARRIVAVGNALGDLYSISPPQT